MDVSAEARPVRARDHRPGEEPGLSSADSGPQGVPYRSRLPHQPGLDGLRGIAVLAMLAFHGGFPWARGGFLALSLFFTLSGFLITSLLLVEFRDRGRIDLLKFWWRRFRRLAPAAFVALGLIVVYGAFAATPAQRVNLPGDIRAALLYVANWRMLATGHSYAELFVAPSPVQHFWSLAVEEQFYLVFPVLTAGLFMWLKGSRRLFATVLGGLVAASLLAQLVITNRDRIYYGTDTRAGEFLVGALLAVCVTGYANIIGKPRSRGAAGALGVGAAAWLLFAWSQMGLGEAWLYRGGFLLVGIASAAVVCAALVPGPVRSVSSLAPLRAVGMISYGLYLYHWPVFLWLNESRTALPRGELFLLRMAVTALIAILSYFLVEEPIRSGRTLTRARSFLPALGASAAVVALSATLFIPIPDAAHVINQADFSAAAKSAAASLPADTGAHPVSGVAKPLRVYIVGDSSGLLFGAGLQTWGTSNGKVVVANDAFLNCPIARFGQDRRGVDQTAIPITDYCNTISDHWAADIARFSPDVIMVMAGPSSTTARELPGDNRFRTLDDPTWSAYFWKEMNRDADILESGHVPILWFDQPYLQRDGGAAIGHLDDASLPALTDAYNKMIDRLDAARPSVLRFDLARHLDSLSLDRYLRLMPDGIHLDAENVPRVMNGWGWRALVDAYQRGRADVAAPTSANAAAAPRQPSR